MESLHVENIIFHKSVSFLEISFAYICRSPNHQHNLLQCFKCEKCKKQLNSFGYHLSINDGCHIFCKVHKPTVQLASNRLQSANSKEMLVGSTSGEAPAESPHESPYVSQELSTSIRPLERDPSSRAKPKSGLAVSEPLLYGTEEDVPGIYLHLF